MTPDTITGLAAALRDGSTTPRALLAGALAHVEGSDKDLNAYLTVTRELAEQQADAAARTLEDHPDTASPLYKEGEEWAGLCFAVYSAVCFLFSFALPAAWAEPCPRAPR